MILIEKFVENQAANTSEFLDHHTMCRRDSRARAGVPARRRAYSALMPLSAMILANLAVSRFITSAISSGVEGSGTAPALISLPRTGSVVSAVRRAAFSLSMNGRGSWPAPLPHTNCWN